MEPLDLGPFEISERDFSAIVRMGRRQSSLEAYSRARRKQMSRDVILKHFGGGL